MTKLNKCLKCGKPPSRAIRRIDGFIGFGCAREGCDNCGIYYLRSNEQKAANT